MNQSLRHRPGQYTAPGWLQVFMQNPVTEICFQKSTAWLAVCATSNQIAEFSLTAGHDKAATMSVKKLKAAYP